MFKYIVARILLMSIPFLYFSKFFLYYLISYDIKIIYAVNQRISNV